jgi:hypothetical protein
MKWRGRPPQQAADNAGRCSGIGAWHMNFEKESGG